MTPDLGLIIAISGTGASIVAVTVAMFLWLRSEANSDRRHFQEVQREDRKDMLGMIRSIELEMKDFHYKLIEIERNRK